jgi:peptidoglycan glycosyltransferase
MEIKSNIRKLSILFITFFIALSAGLVYWQVLAASQVTADPRNSRHCLADSAPIRGNIYDRNGKLLAYSTPSPTGCGYIRHYTDPSLAPLIGYYVDPQLQATGIEAAFNDYLDGQVGATGLKNTVNSLLHQPPVGDNIYLTIDDRIQQIVNKDFDTPVPVDNVNVFSSDRGSVIVTDPHTGDILAMLSRPSYDPNKLVQTLAQGDYSYYDQLIQQQNNLPQGETQEQPLLNHATQETFIPGSIFKTMTLSAGIDSGHTTLSQPFGQKQALGPIVINGETFGPTGNNISGYTVHFPVTTRYGYTHSDNIIFAQVGVETSQSTWLNYANRFYIGQKIPFALPVTTSTVLRNGQPLASNELAADAFGQGFDAMTPLQMSLIDDAVANGGQLMQPQIIDRIVDPNKTVIQSTSALPLGAQQISAQTAADVRLAMYGVVQCGSGSIFVPGAELGTSPWSIIAKTGTGQVSNSGQVGAQGWLLTQAPYYANNPSQLPKLTIVALKENGGDGGVVVGPMVTAMYNDIFSQVMTNTQKPAASNARQYCCSTGLLQLGC